MSEEEAAERAGALADGRVVAPQACREDGVDVVVEEKIHAICETFASQSAKHWFTDDTFRALMRLRGVEVSARYAEAFYARKLAIA